MKNEKNLMKLGRSILAGLLLAMACTGLASAATAHDDATTPDAVTGVKGQETARLVANAALQETDHQPDYHTDLIQKLKNVPCDNSF